MKMKVLGSAVAVVLTGALTGFAAETYQASLEAGDSARAANQPDRAIAEYDAAIEKAHNTTETALALSKKAYVLAYNKSDYAAARALADKALALFDADPVGHVTAYQVVAKCQMAKEDYMSAAATLKKAQKLQGVDWAQPDLAVMLGDCYRLVGYFDEALGALRSVLGMPSAGNGIKAVAQLNMGFTYQYGLKNPGAAREAYGQAAALNPDLRGAIDQHLSKLP